MPTQTLAQHPIHLGRGASAHVEPAFTGGMDWYSAYETRHAGDGAEGRLVSWYSFNKSWESWEMHPAGDEVVICVSGRIELIQEQPDGAELRLALGPGEYAINPPGVWHSADTAGAVCMFITAGAGTQHKPRE